MNFKYSTLGFDKIYVINLKRRKDRKERLIKEIEAMITKITLYKLLLFLSIIQINRTEIKIRISL